MRSPTDGRSISLLRLAFVRWQSRLKLPYQQYHLFDGNFSQLETESLLFVCFKNTTDESEYVLTLIINYLLIAFEFYAPCAPWRSEPPWWNTYSIAHNLQCATFQHFRLGASIAVWESQRTSQLSPPFLPRSYIGTAGLNPKLGGVGCNSVPDPSPCIL